MRYWVQLQGKATLMEREGMASLLGIGGDTPVCPEGSDPRNAKSWLPLRSFPDLQALLQELPTPEETRRTHHAIPAWTAAPRPTQNARALAKIPPTPSLEAPPKARSRRLWPWIALAACVWASRQWSQAENKPRRPPPELRRELPPGEAVMNTVLPACRGTIGQVSGGSPEVTRLGEDSYKLAWISADFLSGEPMSFEYRPRYRLLKPLNEAANQLLNAESACGRKL